MKPQTPPTPKEIEKSFTTPISAKDIQKSMDHLCRADSALQIGKKNKALTKAFKHIHNAYKLLSEQNDKERV
jgi:hypothetical protein